MDYQSLQQFLADSPWDPALAVRADTERAVPAIAVEAWMMDDTDFPKDGERSPGGQAPTLRDAGKIGNSQIGVSVHAVGARGRCRWGGRCICPRIGDDPERRRVAKIPDEVEFQTKPELGVELVERAAGWKIAQAPVLGDCAYGDETEVINPTKHY